MGVFLFWYSRLSDIIYTNLIFLIILIFKRNQNIIKIQGKIKHNKCKKIRLID